MLRSLWRREVRLAWRGLRLIAMALGLASSSHGQGGATVRREIRAVRLSPPPVIDGDLSDPCWKQAVRADRFTDVLYGSPAADQTDVFLGYDAAEMAIPWSILNYPAVRGPITCGINFDRLQQR